MKLKSVVAEAVTAGLIFTGCAGSTSKSKARPAAPAVQASIDTVNGHPAQSEKAAQIGEHIWLMPSLEIVKGSANVVTENRAILKGLGNVASLKAWQLCAAELTAEATVEQGSIDVIRKYPTDKPFHHTKAEAAQDVKYLAHEIGPKITALKHAAKIAARAHVDCYDTANPKDLNGHYATISVPGSDGAEAMLRVPDSDVMQDSSTVEFLIAVMGYTPQTLADEYAHQLTVPVASQPAPPPKSGEITHTEQHQALDLIKLSAEEQMLKTAGVPN